MSRYAPFGRYAPPAERLWRRIEQNDDGCWIWPGAKNSGGYGHLYIEGALVYTHRLMWELLVGPIPAGMHLDHLCRVRACCNPGHAEIVTCGENVRRGESPSVQAWRTDRCIRNHDLTNAYVTKTGRRQCRECKNLRRRKGVALVAA